MTDDPILKPETLAAHGLYPGDPQSGGVVPPMQPSTTFLRDADYKLVVEGQSYARDENPTFRPAEALLAHLEGGAGALLFGSGVAAGAAVVQALAPGDRVVAPKVMYWGLRNRFRDFAARWGIDFVLFDATVPGDLERAVAGGPTKLVWIETPCNPTWDLIDIAAAAKVAHDAGARLAVDSTVATPVITRPIELGADIVMHSATKYLNGHSDVVAGALVTAKADDLWGQIKVIREGGGALLGSFEAWLLHRGMRTLFVRVRRASETALAIARHFEGHPKLDAVLYPGLASHPGHDIARRQMGEGFGGMLSLRVKGGGAAALTAVKTCRVFTRATSLGGVESLVEHRASIEGPDSPVPPDLIRLSVGIEHPDDLITDLEQALATI